ncbi:MAG: oligosaccharide flippase family protein [Planctomycetota bacterium]|nr:oligosaccharide flippase family protein [Planctomycetota bacterium]
MFKYIGSSWLLTIVQIVVMMQLTPFMLDAFDVQANAGVTADGQKVYSGSYGVWLVIVAMTGILKLFIVGMPMASVRFLSQCIEREDDEAYSKVLSTCIGMCLMLGAAAVLVGGGLYFFFDAQYLSGEKVSRLGPDALRGARIAYLMVVVQLGAGFAGRLPYAILAAHHDFYHRNAIQAGELVLRMALTMLFLSYSADIIYLAAIQFISLVLEFCVAMYVVKRRHPNVKFNLASYDGSRMPSILSFSLYSMLLNVGALLAFRIDALVIGKSSWEVAGVTMYDNGNKFFEYMISLVCGIALVVMPFATRMRTRGDISQLNGIFFKWSKIALSLALCIGLYLLVLGPEFLEAWLGDDYRSESGTITQILVVSFFFFLPVRGVALPIMMGLGLPKKPAIALLLMGALNLAISAALVESEYGLNGVAFGTAIPNTLFAIYVVRVTCRELSVTVSSYLSYVVSRAVIGSVIPIAFLFWCKRGLEVEGWIPVLASGVGMVFLFALTWIFFVYRNDAHLDLRGEIAAKLGRGGAA